MNTMIDTWDPRQYDKFQREREQPFYDLLALVNRSPGMRVVDLGCGTGKLTEELHVKLRARSTVGIDRSERMLEGARDRRLPPGLTFEVGTIESFAGRDRYDLIVSNAAFHWVEDHDALIRRLAAALAPGGQLAFQVPAMHDDPTHTVAEDLAASPRFRDAFGGWHRPQPVKCSSTASSSGAVNASASSARRRSSDGQSFMGRSRTLLPVVPPCP